MGNLDKPSYNTAEQIQVTEKNSEAVTDQARKDLEKLKEQLIVSGLPIDAFELMKKSLWIKEPVDIASFQNAITKYQREHWLKEDKRKPMVWPETYTEMKAWEVNEKIDQAVKTKKLSQSLKNDILVLLEGGWKWINYLLLTTDKLNLIKTNFPETEKDFIETNLPTAMKKWAVVVQQDPQTTKSLFQLWDGINDVINWDMTPTEFIKQFKWPALFAWLIWFVFLGGSMFWWKWWTWSIWWRIGWVVWLWALGLHKPLLNLTDKAVNWLSESAESWFISWIPWKTSEMLNSSKERMSKIFKEKFPEYYDKISESLWVQFENVTSKISRYNNSLKDKDPAYIEETKLDVFQSKLLIDKKFLNTSKLDLGKISDMTTLKSYTNADTQKALNDTNVTDDDVKHFIKKHLIEQSFDNDDEIVADIFLTTDAKNLIFEKVTLNATLVKSNEKLDKEVKADLRGLINSTDSILRNVGKKLTIALKDWELDNFKVDDFPSLNPTQKWKIQTLIDKFNYILKWEIHIQEKIDYIENSDDLRIRTDEEFAETQETLEAKYNLLNWYSYDTSKVTGHSFSIDKFEDAKKVKEKEILDYAKVLNVKTLGGVSVSTRVQELEIAWKLIADKQAIDKLSIWEVPNKDSKPVEFKKYWDANKDKFDKVEAIWGNYSNAVAWTPEAEIKDKAEGILNKKVEFKDNYEAVKDIYVIKISDIEYEINTISDELKTKTSLSNAEYKDYKEKLDKKMEELSTISWEIVEWFTIQKVWNFIKDFKDKASWKIVIEESDNFFEYLDKKLPSRSKDIDIDKHMSTIANKFIEVESKLDLEIDDNVTFDTSNWFTSTTSKFIEVVNEKKVYLNNIKNDEIKERKENDLERRINWVIWLYVDEVLKINDVTNLPLLKQIEEDYERNFKSDFISKLTDFVTKDKFEQAYKKKLEEFEEDIFQKRLETLTFSELSAWETNLLNDYVNNIKTSNSIELGVYLNNILGANWNIKSNLKLKDIISVIHNISTLFTDLNSLWLPETDENKKLIKEIGKWQDVVRELEEMIKGSMKWKLLEWYNRLF